MAGREDGRIVVGAQAVDGMVVITVDDNGEGMGPDVRRRAFEPFFTAPAETTWGLD